MTGNSGALAVRTNSFRERSPQMVMVLAHRSRVYETRDTSPADVASSWYGLSPDLAHIS